MDKQFAITPTALFGLLHRLHLTSGQLMRDYPELLEPERWPALTELLGGAFPESPSEVYAAIDRVTNAASDEVRAEMARAGLAAGLQVAMRLLRELHFEPKTEDINGPWVHRG